MFKISLKKYSNESTTVFLDLDVVHEKNPQSFHIMLTVERELSLEDGFCIKDIDSFSHQAFNVLSNTLFSAKEMKALEDNYTFKVLSDDNELMETLVTELEAFVDQALDQIEVKVYIPVADRCNQKGL